MADETGTGGVFSQNPFFIKMDSSMLALFQAIPQLFLAELEVIEGGLQDTATSPLDAFSSSLFQTIEPIPQVIQQHSSPLSKVLFRDLVREDAEGENLSAGNMEFGPLLNPESLDDLDDFQYEKEGEDQELDDNRVEISSIDSGSVNFPKTPAVEVDTGLPAAPVVTSISDDTGASPSDGVTSDQTLFFHGTAEADSTVEVFIGGVSIGTTTANGAGAWTFDHTGTTLPAGPYVVSATATDLAGNTGPSSADFDVTIDTSGPLVNLTFDDNVLSLNAPDHTFETNATRNYFDYSSGGGVKTVTAMSFNNGSNVKFNASGTTDVTANEGSRMLGMRAKGKTQAEIETDLGVASGIFDTIDPDGGGPKGPLNITDGSYAQTVLYARTGDVVKFDWNFLGPETAAQENNRNDVVFVVIYGVVTELTRSSDVTGPAVSGWQTFTYTATEEGPVEISFALFNVQNQSVDSGFTLDNFRINNALVQKQPVELNINLTVTDETAISSSDVLITISGVDLTSTLSAGTNMGGGLWELSIADLEGLTMTPPNASTPGYTGTETLTITAKATDSAGNITTVTDAYVRNRGVKILM